MIPIPKKLRLKGIKDMVRIIDSRMSGISCYTVILHVVPEAAMGGTLAVVENGDMITVDIINRKLSLNISEEELAARKATWKAQVSKHRRGYPQLFIREDYRPKRSGTLNRPLVWLAFYYRVKIVVISGFTSYFSDGR